jgi:hypothetical protein
VVSGVVTGTVEEGTVVGGTVVVGTVVDGTVVDGTVVDVALADEVAPGWKVAMNGVALGVGNATGTLLIFIAHVADPSSTAVTPVAGICWVCPACMVPVQMTEPVELEVACTQHGPVETIVT